MQLVVGYDDTRVSMSEHTNTHRQSGGRRGGGPDESAAYTRRY